MSTTLDFKALRARERARMKAEAQASVVEAGPSSAFHLDKREYLNKAAYEVKGQVGGISYIREWITEEEATKLLRAIDEVPSSTWTNLHGRRLQNLGGTPLSNGMRPVPVPPFAQAVFDALVQAGVFPPDQPPNHILLNEYIGQGIASHKDGPLYADTVAILSLGDEALIQFWPNANPKEAPAKCAVQVQHRSLLIFQGEAYNDYYHGILKDPDASPTSRRVSLTVRRVLKVKNADEAEIVETAEQRREEKRENMRFLMSITDDRPDLKGDD